jgi:L-ascorbate peroxidase
VKPNTQCETILQGISLDNDTGATPDDEKKVADPAPTDDTNGAAPQPEPFVAAEYSYKKVHTCTI